MKKYIPAILVVFLTGGLLGGLAWLCNEEYNKIQQQTADAAARDALFAEIKRKTAEEEALAYKRITADCEQRGGIAVKLASQNKFDFQCVKRDAVIVK